MVRKTIAKKTTTSSTHVFESDRFQTEKNQKTYEKLNIYQSVWVEHKVILDELDSETCKNFKRRGWLPLLEVEHPPPIALIREFYSNLSVHFDDSNTQYVRSWIRGEEYVLTPFVVASTLRVPLVWQPVYPYTKTPPLDDIMSYITSTSISWGTNPHIISHELTEFNYLFSGISYHSIWPIFHLHTIPIKRCAFLYALVIDAPMSFPTLFIRSLVEVHRIGPKSHGLFFPVLIHRILLALGLEDFPAPELVHIIAPIGVTFLRQRAAQLKASSKCPRVESSSGDASRPPTSDDPTIEEYAGPTPASIQRILDTVMTVQAVHGQILVDVLVELQALRADLASTRHSTPPPPFDDES